MYLLLFASVMYLLFHQSSCLQAFLAKVNPLIMNTCFASDQTQQSWHLMIVIDIVAAKKCCTRSTYVSQLSWISSKT
jgi:hypothetical protein